MDNEILRKLKVVFIAHYSFEMNSEGFKKAENYLKQIEDMVTKDPDWKDGKHYGDCTRHSTPCERCWLENWERDAINALEFIKGEV